MIIDSHAHVVMPPEVYRYQADLVASRANPTIKYPGLGEEALQKSTDSLIKLMDDVGTDIQFISPRPFAQLHSIKPGVVTQLWTECVNDIIYEQCKLYPNRLWGVAGLPQYRDTSPENCIEELERCVKELGFIGCLLNPDPMEGDGAPPPGLGDEFWYPLYEKLVELDVPALIHSASCCHARESYTLKFINEESIGIISLLDSKVFEDFPKLKIVVSHAGGAIPYHMGRFRAWNVRRKESQTFDQKMRQLYFDTCNYSKEALEFLFQIIGADNCMFGTERPGTGSVEDPTTGRQFDDLKPVIQEIDWLSDEDKTKIFEGTCKKVYTTNFDPKS